MWPRLTGLMSRKATASAVSSILADGIAPCDDLAEDAVRIVRCDGSRRCAPHLTQPLGRGVDCTDSHPPRLRICESTVGSLDQAPRDEPTTAGLAGALIVSFSPRRAITAMGDASPCRTLASL